MKTVWLVVTVLVGLLLSLSVSWPLSSGVGQQSDVNEGSNKDAALDNYIRLVLNNFFASLATGFPALGIPPMDPLPVGNISIPNLQVQGGQVDVEAANVQVTGLSLLTVTTLHMDLSNLTMDLRAFMPYMRIDGLYSLDGIALVVLPIYGDGPFYIQVFDVNMMGGGSLGLDETGNYVQLTSLYMDLNFATMVVQFDNLLGGGDFGDTLNSVISALGIAIFDKVKPIVIDALTQGIITVVNDALSRYPIGNLTLLA